MRRLSAIWRDCLGRTLLRVWLLVLLGCMPGGDACADALLSLRFSHLGTEQGLPGEAVFSMAQDRRGLIWLGTNAGLVRFDGRHLKVFRHDPDQADTLSNWYVFALTEDTDGQMWVGTGSGLDRIDLHHDTVRRLQVPAIPDTPQRMVDSLAQGRPGTLWVGVAGGLFQLDTRADTFTRIALPPAGEGGRRVRALLADGQGGVWVGWGGTVLHLDARGRPLLQFDTRDGDQAAGLPAAALTVRQLAFDAKGRLWVGLSGGLQTWQPGPDGPRPDPMARRLELGGNAVYALMPGHDESMWLGVGGGQGLLRWRDNGEPPAHFRHLAGVPASLGADSVASLMLDSSGSLWVGCRGGGANITDLRSIGFDTYLSVPGDLNSLSSDAVFAMVQDGPEHAWVGSYGGGLNRLHLSSGHVERIAPTEQPIMQIKALARDAQGRLWVGGDGGLVRYDPRRRRSERVELRAQSSAAASISSLLIDQLGQLWAGSAAGLYRIDAQLQVQSLRADGQPGSLTHDTIDCLLEDQAGRLWIGTKGGLLLYKPQDGPAQQGGFVEPLSPSTELPQPRRLSIQAMRQDNQGHVWLATNEGLYELLARSTGWQLKSWRQVPGMPRQSFESVQDAIDGEIWLGSDQGLTRLDPATRQARFYPAQDRFGGGFNFGAAARGDDGSIYFGGEGLLRFSPGALRDNPLPPRVLLSDLRLFNRSLLPSDGGPAVQAGGLPDRGPALPSLAALGIPGVLAEARTLQLRPQDGMVSFELSALHFDRRAQNRYAWRLEGFDEGWIEGQGDQGVATYTNLFPGHYRLLARAANPDGIWGPEQALLEVDVQAPYWRTGWWYLLLGTGGLLLLAAAHRLRLRSLRQAQDRLERLVEQRTREVTRQGEELAQRQQQAEAQRELAEKARRDIGLLSEIGREITGALQLQDLQRTLYRHVSELMDANVFGVGIVDWDARVIRFEFVMQDGRPFEPYLRSLDAGEQPASQCALQARELLIDEFPHDNRRLDDGVRERSGPARLRLRDGGEPRAARSGLYVPMSLKGQVMGVISVLSEKPQAFASTDLDILRTLGAYAAVAYDNAETYRRLQLTQAQLVEQEKLVGLGSLVAGIAHELNTPIGNSLLVASTLRDASQAFLSQAGSGSLKRSELQRFCEQTEASSELMLRSLHNAASLISSFKQLAVDQTSDQRRSFALHTLCEEVALSLAPRLRRDDHHLQLGVQPDLTMDSYPGPLSQVLTNLILNAVIHGFDGRRQGRIELRAEALGPQQVLITLRDDGCGIPSAHLKRVFDPFFTTKLGQGGSGLGLHISYNIVHALLGGSIRVRSEPGEGTLFIIELPRVAPSPAPSAEAVDGPWATGAARPASGAREDPLRDLGQGI